MVNDTCSRGNIKKKNYQVYIIGGLEFSVEKKCRRSLRTDSQATNQQTEQANWNSVTENSIFYEVSFTTPKHTALHFH